MVKQEPVNLTHQTIFAIIPYVSFYAFYRIQKLRKLVLIYLGVGFAFVPIQWIMFSGIYTSTITNPFDLYSNPLFLMYNVGIYISIYGLSVYFIRRWSKKWNEQFSENSGYVETK